MHLSHDGLADNFSSADNFCCRRVCWAKSLEAPAPVHCLRIPGSILMRIGVWRLRVGQLELVLAKNLTFTASHYQALLANSGIGRTAGTNE